jgi:chemotaxis protein histidine kinase CheA
VEAGRSNERLSLSIRDNGIGISEERMATLAREKGFTPQTGETLFDILFWDGVSTADTLTITSGRGVGLAALKTSVQERGGHIGIRNQDSRPGTILRAEWPQ